MNNNEWMQYSGLGIQMAITIMIFWWIGQKIEEKDLIENPYGQLFGMFFGVFVSIAQLIKSVK